MTGSFSFNVGLSPRKTQSIVNKVFDDHLNSQVNTIWGGLGSSSSSTSYKEPSFGDMFLTGLQATVMAGLSGFMQMGLQMMTLRMYASMFGLGGTKSTSSSNSTSGDTVTRSSGDINKDIGDKQKQLDKAKAEYTALETKLNMGSDAAKAELNKSAKDLFGAASFDAEHKVDNNANLTDVQKTANKMGILHNEILDLTKANVDHRNAIDGINDRIGQLDTDIESAKNAANEAKGNALESETLTQKTITDIESKIENAKTPELKDKLIKELATARDKANADNQYYNEQYYKSLIEVQNKEKEKAEKEKERKGKEDSIDNNEKAIKKKQDELDVLKQKNSDLYTKVDNFESKKRNYATNSPSDIQEKLKKQMKEKQDLINKLKAEIEDLKDDRDAARKAEAEAALVEKRKNKAALNFATADRADGNSWQRGWFGNKSGKTGKKEQNELKESYADAAGGSSEAKARFKIATADINWKSFSNYKQKNGLRLTKERYIEIVSDIKYSKLRDGNAFTLINNELKEKGYSSSS